MSGVFLSYSREDTEFADRIIRALDQEGLNAWWDQRIPANVDWAAYLESRITKSSAVLVLWSQTSTDSHYVKEEVSLALQLKKLVQVSIDGTEPPFGYRTQQSHILSDWRGQDTHTGWSLTVDALRKLTFGESSVDHLTRTQRKIVPGQRFRDREYTPTLVGIGAPSFEMGDQNGTGGAFEKPVHPVSFRRPFAIGARPVLFDDWDAAIANGADLPRPNDKGWGRSGRPVVNVSWEDAQTYLNWLSKKTKERYRLPSEAEWEYCAKSGGRRDYSFGATLDASEANIGGALGKTSVVGSYPGNSLGLYDMHGNVWEWVQDTWHDNYYGAPKDGSAWEDAASPQRVLRGGSWRFGANEARASFRAADNPQHRSSNYGFRVARDL